MGPRSRSLPRGRAGAGTGPDAAARSVRLWRYALAGSILLVALLRAAHLGFPLERDEGEFGYIAQELLRGVPVYVSAHTQKLPGTYWAYALFMSLFGQTAAGIHLGLLLVNAAMMALIHLVVRATHDRPSAWLAATVFGLAGMSPMLYGFAFHAAFLVALCALAGAWLLLRARRSGAARTYALSGLCFGLSVLMKQTGALFVPAVLVLMVLDHRASEDRSSRALAVRAAGFVAGALLPLAATAAWYLAIGRFGLFWFWAWEFAGEFSGQVTLRQAVDNLAVNGGRAVSGFEVLWVLAAAGLAAALLDRGRRAAGRFHLMFALASLATIVPGLYFTSHYFISLLPAMAMLIGVLAGCLAGPGRRAAYRRAAAAAVWLAAAAGVAAGVSRYSDYYSKSTGDDMMARIVYPGNPFPESVELAAYLRAHTTVNDRIAVLGSETQVLFYARRRSASRFVNVYYLTAIHPRAREMQREMAGDIESAKPRYVVAAYVPTSWLWKPGSPTDLLAWWDRYSPAWYELEGVCELGDGEPTWRWGADARAPRRNSAFLAVLGRRAEPAGGGGRPVATQGTVPATLDLKQR